MPTGKLKLHFNARKAAQKALEGLNSAITSNDAIRAGLGTMGNWPENACNTMQFQAEHGQAAALSILDMDAALDLMEFVHTHMRVRSASAMLSLVSPLPKMALALLR